MCLCGIQIVLAFVFANFGNPDRMPNRSSKKSWDLVLKGGGGTSCSITVNLNVNL